MNLLLPSYKVLRILEYVFFAIMVLSLTYIGYFFLASSSAKHNYISSPVDSSQARIDETVSLDLKPYDFYVQKINSRDIFTNSGVSLPGDDPNKVALPADQLPPNLKVVGVDLGLHSQVIVEDSNAHQTYFIEQGKQQAGIAFQSVTKNKVFLTYQGQTIRIDLKGNQIYASKTNP